MGMQVDKKKNEKKKRAEPDDRKDQEQIALSSEKNSNKDLMLSNTMKDHHEATF